jgi:hypothetical protein
VNIVERNRKKRSEETDGTIVGGGTRGKGGWEGLGRVMMILNEKQVFRRRNK